MIYYFIDNVNHGDICELNIEHSLPLILNQGIILPAYIDMEGELILNKATCLIMGVVVDAVNSCVWVYVTPVNEIK